MNSHDYTIGWTIYLSGATGLFLCWFWLTRKIPWSSVRNLLRWLGVALLFTPYTLEPPYESWAPALIIVLFESLIGGVDGAARAGVPLIISVSAAVILCFLWEFLRNSFLGGKPDAVNRQRQHGNRQRESRQAQKKTAQVSPAQRKPLQGQSKQGLPNQRPSVQGQSPQRKQEQRTTGLGQSAQGKVAPGKPTKSKSQAEAKSVQQKPQNSDRDEPVVERIVANPADRIR